jgi:hypothetical protein
MAMAAPTMGAPSDLTSPTLCHWPVALAPQLDAAVRAALGAAITQP